MDKKERKMAGVCWGRCSNVLCGLQGCFKQQQALMSSLRAYLDFNTSIRGLLSIEVRTRLLLTFDSHGDGM